MEPEYENKIIKSVKVICYVKNSLMLSTSVQMSKDEEKYGKMVE